MFWVNFVTARFDAQPDVLWCVEGWLPAHLVERRALLLVSENASLLLVLLLISEN